MRRAPFTAIFCRLLSGLVLSTIQKQEVDLSEYADFHDGYQQIGRFLDDVYTCKRIHSMLTHRTPTEFEE